MMKYQGSLLKTVNLTKQYNLKNVVDKVNLEIPKSCCGFIGPNGAGKTTLILMILDLIQPTEGKISLLGKGYGKKKSKSEIKIGYLPENVGFYPRVTGYNHVLFYAKLREVNDPERVTKSLLEWCGLKKTYWYRNVKTYSKGMRQRLGLAQAFIGKPDIVFLDEPLSSIDPLGRDDLINKIQEKKEEGINIFISSHIIQEVERIIDHLVIINEGKIKFEGNFIELAIAHGFHEFEVGFNKKDSENSINKPFKEISSMKLDLSSEPILLNEKVIIKSQDLASVNKLVENLHDSYDLYLKPITGTLIKLYKMAIENE